MTRYGQPFVLTIADPEGLLSDRPRVKLGQGADELEITLKDDGDQPDVEADDQTWTALVDLYPTSADRMMLLDGPREVTSFPFTIEATGRAPSVVVTLSAEGADVETRYEGKASEDEAAAHVPVRSAEDGPEASGGRSVGSAGPMPGGGPGGVQEGASLTLLSIGVFLAGALLGGGAVWLRLRRGPGSRVKPVGGGPALPVTPGDPTGRGPAQVWVSPNPDDALASAAARWASAWGPVLLVPAPQNRARLSRVGARTPHVLWLSDDQPEPAELAAARDSLPGRAAIVVDGLGALVPPGPNEAPTGPIEELCQHADVIVVLHASDPIPANVPVFRWQDADGLRVEGGALTLR